MRRQTHQFSINYYLGSERQLACWGAEGAEAAVPTDNELFVPPGESKNGPGPDFAIVQWDGGQSLQALAAGAILGA